MAKVLLINPNKYGRGHTHIWIASHSSILKKNNHNVRLFDATFYKDWINNGEDFENEHPKTNYEKLIKLNDRVIESLQIAIDNFKPDIIFWSAISSHIHSEGEYVNIQNGYDLVKQIKNKHKAKLITAGLQATSAAEIVLKKMSKIDYVIRGESELVLKDICDKIDKNISFINQPGIAFLEKDKVVINQRQQILNSLDPLTPYDYSIFDDQVFLKKYKGEVIRGIDYEISRGCIYSCSYCVETIIQKYYGFEEKSKNTGAIKNFKKYLRYKSARNAFNEIKNLHLNYGVTLFRCQDTNFLTIDRDVLKELAELIDNSSFNIKLYIETRPEGINEKSIDLLKKLKVHGVGMGIEAASESFRQDNLNRFADQQKIINAFKMLKENGIQRTSYNILGAPKQDEQSMLDTIEFNRLLKPDSISLHYYTPYYGTQSHRDGVNENMFDEYEFDADTYLRSKSKSKKLPPEKLKEIRNKFVALSSELGIN